MSPSSFQALGWRLVEACKTSTHKRTQLTSDMHPQPPPSSSSSSPRSKKATRSFWNSSPGSPTQVVLGLTAPPLQTDVRRRRPSRRSTRPVKSSGSRPASLSEGLSLKLSTSQEVHLSEVQSQARRTVSRAARLQFPLRPKARQRGGRAAGETAPTDYQTTSSLGFLGP